MVGNLLVLTGVALAVTGCETNAERSARLERLAREERLRHPRATQRGVVVKRESRRVRVVGTAVVHDENGVAAMVVLRNVSARPIRDAPIALTVTGAGGEVLYRNDAPGLDGTLTSVGLLAPGRETVWVDDQVQASGTPTAAGARVGEGELVGSTETPRLEVTGLQTFTDPSNGIGAKGTVVNASEVTQEKLVVYVVGRRAGHVVAAGRAVLPEVPAGGRTPLQVFFIGSPRGARLEASAPATTLR